MTAERRETQLDLLASNGRVVMISGGSRGIGAAIARRLFADGFTVSIGVRQPDAVRAKFAGLDPRRLLVTRFDALDPASALAWVEETVARCGRLDALVNNAGI